MRHWISIYAFLLFIIGCAPKLTKQDALNLYEISYLLINRPQITKKTYEDLRTPALLNIVAKVSKFLEQDLSIVTPSYLSRPDRNELALWYIIVYSNTFKFEGDSLWNYVNEEYCKARSLDMYFLLDNYYTQSRAALGFLFNDADLRGTNIILTDLGLRDKIEEAICFLTIVDNLIASRFDEWERPENVLRYTDRMPMFNGSPYYQYMDLAFPDFKMLWGIDTIEYNTYRIGSFLKTLLAHMQATQLLRGQEAADQIYLSSILSKPQYFKYSKDSLALTRLYNNYFKKS